jgi:Flp pilus assembly secretin CpaC
MYLDKFIKSDCDDFTSHYPDIQITDGKDISFNNITAKIKYLSGKSYGNYEAVAYIDAKKTCVMIVLSSRTKEGFDNALGSFDSLVKSYWFISDKVKIKKTK